MNISGINNSNYYVGSSRVVKNAKTMTSNGTSNAECVSSNITLNYSGTKESGNALTAVGFPDGSSASVYKADYYSQANPEYRVRYWDNEGNYTDTNVKINSIEPSNASYLEMLAYTTYSDVQGMTSDAYGNFQQAASGLNGDITYDCNSIKEKKDFMSMVKEFMQLQYDCSNLAGYLSIKQLYDYMKME